MEVNATGIKVVTPTGNPKSPFVVRSLLFMSQIFHVISLQVVLQQSLHGIANCLDIDKCSIINLVVEESPYDLCSLCLCIRSSRSRTHGACGLKRFQRNFCLFALTSDAPPMMMSLQESEFKLYAFKCADKKTVWAHI